MCKLLTKNIKVALTIIMNTIFFKKNRSPTYFRIETNVSHPRTAGDESWSDLSADKAPCHLCVASCCDKLCNCNLQQLHSVFVQKKLCFQNFVVAYSEFLLLERKHGGRKCTYK
jgi:hypothetical protein